MDACETRDKTDFTSNFTPVEVMKVDSPAPTARPVYGSGSSLWAPAADRDPGGKTFKQVFRFFFFFFFSRHTDCECLLTCRIRPSIRPEYLAASLATLASRWRASFNISWEGNHLSSLHVMVGKLMCSSSKCQTWQTLNKNLETEPLTEIISSRAFSTFSRAWFIRLDICLLGGETHVHTISLYNQQNRVCNIDIQLQGPSVTGSAFLFFFPEQTQNWDGRMWHILCFLTHIFFCCSICFSFFS